MCRGRERSNHTWVDFCHTPSPAAIEISVAVLVSGRASLGRLISPCSDAKVPPEGAEGRQIVRGREDVEVPQRRLHPTSERLVGRAAKQRVEPDDAARTVSQGVELVRELFRATRVPSIAQNHHDGAAIDQSRPTGVECGEALADARTSRPTLHPGREPYERGTIAVAREIRRHAAERRTEHECLYAGERVLQRVEKLKKDTTINVHGSRHVAE